MRVSAYAKINLSLRVLGVRTDGYHELRTIFQSIALHDTLTVRARRGSFALKCNDPDCPVDETNLVRRAADLVWQATGGRGTVRDVEARLVKRIPLQAGLGGGSSDGAAALRLFGSLWRAKEAVLRELAATLGADVPYFLEGGTVLGLDRGDLLYPLIDYPTAWVALVIPRFGVSTVDAYRWWDQDGGPEGGGPINVRPTHEGRTLPQNIGRTLSGPVSTSGSASDLRNDLQAAVAARHPEIARLVAALLKAGAFHAAMSGSGSAIFGLFNRRPDAEHAARTLSKSSRTVSGARDGGVRSIVVTRTVNRAAYQRLAGIAGHRINLPFAPRSRGRS